MAPEDPAHAGRLGVLGGTFDPIHFGHLIAAEVVRDQFELERVLFVPAARPPHKASQRVTPAEHRLAMVRLAVSGNPYFEVSTIEIARPGASYTVDTVRTLRRQIGPAGRLYLIIGADSVLDLPTWKDPLEILEYCDILAVTRAGYDGRGFDRMVDRMVKAGGAVHRVTIPEVFISSSEIRKRISEGRSIKYLVPDAVGEYIGRTGLYRD